MDNIFCSTCGGILDDPPANAAGEPCSCPVRHFEARVARMNVLELNEGFLFLGRDGRLYRATYDLDAYWNMDGYGLIQNGWGVELTVLEYWGREFPEMIP